MGTLVAMNVRGNRDLVKDCANGFLIPLVDAKALSRPIARLIDSSELRREMGKKSQEIVGAYAIGRVLKAMLVVHRKVLKGR